MRLHGERILQLAVSQNLDQGANLADEPGTDEQVGSHRRPRRKNVEPFDVDHGEFDAHWIMKSALRNPAAERHLAALETGAPGIALARFLSLVALARRLAELRADPASHAHLAVPRSARRLQIGKVHSHVVLNVRFPRKASILFFYIHQMPDLEYHPANGRRVGPLHDLVHPA